jgi:SAM-dependent methyltransferase
MSSSLSGARSGVLCMPFPRGNAEQARNDRLLELRSWVSDAAEVVDISVSPIQGVFDTSGDVIDQIYTSIRAADIVIGLVDEDNSNVFYECGFAVGCGKPVLYVANEEATVPFDIAGVERFTYTTTSTKSQKELSEAIAACLDAAKERDELVAPLMQAVQYFIDFPTDSPRLFRLSLARHLSDVGNRIMSTGPSHFDVIGAADILDAGTYILSHIEQQGFATQYYSGQASWRDLTSKGVRDDYFEATRAAVGEGREVTRVYVVDEESQIDDSAFRETVMADVRAGVNVKYIELDDLPDDRASDFGIWDNELLALIEYSHQGAGGGPPRLYRCTYRSDRVSLREADRWRTHVERYAKPCPDLPSETDLLAKSVFALDEKGALYCAEEGNRKQNCCDYHLPWQKLRQCGVVSTPGWHSGFYRSAVVDWATAIQEREDFGGTARILITGLADYGMLYWLIQSIPAPFRSSCEIDVLDICRTPLESCHWLRLELERVMPELELSVVPHHEDLLEHLRPAREFDLILSDAFLTRFTDESTKVAVMEEWVRLLRPGGRLLTTARVRSSVGDIEQGDRYEFVKRAERNAHDRGLDPDVAGEAAIAYAEYITSYPFAGLPEMRAFLRKFDDSLRFVKQSVRDPEIKLIEEQEMVAAHYARLELERI